MSGRSVELALRGRCALACPSCDCTPKRADADVGARLAGGGARAVIRGGTDYAPELFAMIRQTREAGFTSTYVRTSAMRAREPKWLAELVAAGAHGVIVSLSSHVSRVHDAIARAPGALVDQLIGIRAFADVGLAIEVELPVLSVRVQQLDALVALALRAVPVLARVGFRRAAWSLPAAIAPEAWDVTGPALARGVDACLAATVPVEIGERDGIPPCALASRPDLLTLFRFDRRRKTRLLDGRAQPDESCAICQVKRHCGGLSSDERQRHGARGIVAFRRRPREFVGQAMRSSPWTSERRAAASKAELLVLRPTVNCNQDCVFCSANETSQNVWSKPDGMYRQIARAAGRGIRNLAFGGGEPTLSPELVGYCRAAKRLGIPKINVVTNGVLLNDTRVRALVDAGLTDAYVSLHAHDEALSRLTTAKNGDFERTVRAIELLSGAGVTTEINHVMTSLNYRYLSEFVEFCSARFGMKAGLNFTFVTPQFRALENLDLMPRLSDVMPHLQRALSRALELGVRFNVGSRQGTPPCFLGRFRGWSDIFEVANVARSEDAIQKQQGAACAECRYRRHCFGLRHPYIERYGFDELVPVRGPAYLDDEVRGTFPVLSFDDVPEVLRDREAELDALALAEAPRAPVRLPVLAMPQRTRPLRVALFGAGRRARLIARAFEELPRLSLEAVCSPRLSVDPLPEFGGCPSFRDALAVLDGQRPEAVIVASNTETHVELARLAIERGLVCLVEKPLGASVAEAEALSDLSEDRGVWVMPAHQVLFSAGLRVFLAEPAARISYLRRCLPSAPDAPQAWSRDALLQTVYHALVVVGHAVGGGRAAVTAVSFAGGGRPTRMRFSLAYSQGNAELEFDFEARVDELLLRTTTPIGERVWRRSGRNVVAGPVDAPLPVEHRQGELAGLLDAFRTAVVTGTSPVATARDGVDVLVNAHALITALRDASAPLSRASAPKHVASRA